MKQRITTYIGLGSNIGDRLHALQTAVDAIYSQIGQIQRLSRIYTSPAQGFEGDDFYNACIEVVTHLPPAQLMNVLLSIEREMGRQRDPEGAYISRIIDLDILLYGEEPVQLKHLTAPHPKMTQRRFVLQPLAEIAGEVVHPEKSMSVSALLDACPDQSPVATVNVWLKNPKNNYSFKDYNFVAIEGNIGAGKTSLATMISEEFNGKLILERFAENPFLPKFYEDPQRYAFTLEMSFLADRYQQISDDLSQLDLFREFVISDYDVFKSLIFSKITLPEEEFKLYRKLFYQVYKDIARPDLYIYLHQNTRRLQENIRKRGRPYEQEIHDEYLDQINSGYLEFLKNHPEFNVKIVDISDLDFVSNRHHFIEVLEQICA